MNHDIALIRRKVRILQYQVDEGIAVKLVVVAAAYYMIDLTDRSTVDPRSNPPRPEKSISTAANPTSSTATPGKWESRFPIGSPSRPRKALECRNEGLITVEIAPRSGRCGADWNI